MNEYIQPWCEPVGYAVIWAGIVYVSLSAAVYVLLVPIGLMIGDSTNTFDVSDMSVVVAGWIAWPWRAVAALIEIIVCAPIVLPAAFVAAVIASLEDIRRRREMLRGIFSEPNHPPGQEQK